MSFYSFWKGTSEELLEESESRLLMLSDVEAEFKSYKVCIDTQKSNYCCCEINSNTQINIEEIDHCDSYLINSKKQDYFVTSWNRDNAECCQECNYIWTYEIGEKTEDKQTIIFVHGYGGGSMQFFKLFKELSKKCHIILCDLPGMGRSSRPYLSFDTAKEWEDYFTSSIEQWRQRMGLTNMILLAHSFGGYIMGRYAAKYPHHVSKISFLSTHGIHSCISNRDAAFEKYANQKKFAERMIFKAYSYFPIKRFSILSVTRAVGRICYPLVKKSYKDLFGGLSDIEFEAIYDYLYQIIMGPASSDYALFQIFKNGLFTDTPLCDSFDEYKKNGIEISFYFGSNDWIDTLCGEIKGRDLLAKHGEKVYIIDDSNHLMQLDNWQELLCCILDDLKL